LVGNDLAASLTLSPQFAIHARREFMAESSTPASSGTPPARDEVLFVPLAEASFRLPEAAALHGPHNALTYPTVEPIVRETKFC
jgi:hypothetical protein